MSDKQSTHTQPRRLYRSPSDKIIAGVAGGLGNYFGVDSTVIRLLFVLLTIFGGSGIFIYIVLWVLVPLEGSKESVGSQETVKQNVKEVEERVAAVASEMSTPAGQSRASVWFGLVILLLGLSFLLSNFGILSLRFVWNLWPLILIFIGISILLNHERGEK